MKKTNWLKLSLDIVLALVLTLLFNKSVLGGLAFHEIAGLAIGIAFVLHKVLNWRWIKQVTSTLFGKKVKFRARLNYLVDFLLLVCMGYIIFSGVMISRVVLPGLAASGGLYKILHVAVSYLALALVGIHVGLHWNWVTNLFGKRANVSKQATAGQPSLVRRGAAIFASLIVLAFGVYGFTATNFVQRVSAMTMVVTGPAGDMAGNAIIKGEVHADSKLPAAGQRPDHRGSMDKGDISGKGSLTGDGNLPEGLAEKGAGSAGSLNLIGALQTIGQYLGTGAFFAWLTFYLSKIIQLAARSKRPKRQVVYPANPPVSHPTVE